MSAPAIIEKMRLSGLSLHTDGGDLIVSPPGRLTDRQRDFLRRHKAEIMAALLDVSQPGNDIDPANDQTPASIDSLPLRLRAAAERVCREVHGDGDEGVAQMLEDLRHYPPDSYPALIRHFEMQLPDDDFDNRRTCRQCVNLTSAGGCRAAQRGEISTAISTWKPDPERLRRCLWFMPKASEQDQRIGHECWPGLELVPGIHKEATP